MMAQGLRHEQKFLLESRGGRVRGPENPCWTTLSQATFPWAAISCVSKDLRILISGLFLDSWGTHHKTRIHWNPSSHSEISKNVRGTIAKGLFLVFCSPEEKRQQQMVTSTTSDGTLKMAPFPGFPSLFLAHFPLTLVRFSVLAQLRCSCFIPPFSFQTTSDPHRSQTP